jgi:hypothetical protein
MSLPVRRRGIQSYDLTVDLSSAPAFSLSTLLPRLSHGRLAWLFETPAMPSALTNASTERVEISCTYAFWITALSAFSATPGSSGSSCPSRAWGCPARPSPARVSQTQSRVPVALRKPVRRMLAIATARQGLRLELHQALGGKADHLAQEIGLAALSTSWQKAIPSSVIVVVPQQGLLVATQPYRRSRAGRPPRLARLPYPDHSGRSGRAATHSSLHYHPGPPEDCRALTPCANPLDEIAKNRRKSSIDFT